jgi:regulator of nucleoside diphosphate kinase
MFAQRQLILTNADRQRLRQLIAAKRESFQTVRDPYDSYLRDLEIKLDQALVVDQPNIEVDVVTMNSTVRVQELATFKSRILTLVYETYNESFPDKVSVLTPLGAAILGSRVGEIVEWNTRRSRHQCRIQRILFQPEAAGEFDL